MLRATTLNTAPFSGTRRCRPARRFDPFGIVPKEPTAVTDDVAEAYALFDDLLALLDVGLIRAVDHIGAIRYTPLDDDASGRGAPVTVGPRP